jgi:hypothetical protein
VDSSITLQYKVELETYGWLENGVSASRFSVEERLTLLRREHERRSNPILRPTGVVPGPLRVVLRTMMMGNGLLVHSHPRRMDPPPDHNPRYGIKHFSVSHKVHAPSLTPEILFTFLHHYQALRRSQRFTDGPYLYPKGSHLFSPLMFLKISC